MFKKFAKLANGREIIIRPGGVLTFVKLLNGWEAYLDLEMSGFVMFFFKI